MKKGRIEVITGGMFGGKSEELVRRLRRAVIAGKDVAAFKHSSDNRYHETSIGCHSGIQFEARAVPSIIGIDLPTQGGRYDVIGIDEVQFFEPEIVSFCEFLANEGRRVIVAGLDTDSHGQPFGPISDLMAIAEDVTKLHAVCVKCGDEASRSFHLEGKTHQVEVGAAQYEARCRACWQLR